MPLSFTDDQVKEATAQILAAPIKVQGLKDAKTNVSKLKQDYKDLDNTNAVYTNFYLNIIEQYHTELKYLNGTLKTAPTTSNIDAGGQLAAGNIYFPITPTAWTKFQPQLAADNNGNPTSTFADTEASKHTPIQDLITLMKTGFNSGSQNQSITSSTSTTVTIATNTGFTAAGTTVVAYGSTGYAYGTIASVSGAGPYIVTVTVQYGNLASLGSGATIYNNDAGFTLTQRETGAGVASNRLNWLNGLKTALDAAVQAWEDTLTAEQTALNANDAPDPEKTQITAAKTNVAAHISTINTWQARPASGSGTSRYGNFMDTEIGAAITTRTGQFTARVAEVIAGLGSVSQNPDGTYTGTGNYYKFFANLDLRLNKTGGTLRNYYQQDLILASFDQQIAVAQNAANRDSQTFVVKEFSADGVNSTRVKLKDANGLASGQDVKVMSNTKPVITTTIVSIDGVEVELGASISADYTVSDRARLVRQL